MTQEEFRSLLVKATATCLDWTRDCVIDDLPEDVIYRVLPNQSCDTSPLVGDEEVFPHDSLAEQTDYVKMNQDQVIQYFHRNGKIPEWIDISVCAVRDNRTEFELLCCGRFTAEKDLMYYAKRGMGPFGIKLRTPPFYEDSSLKEKFSLKEVWDPVGKSQ